MANLNSIYKVNAIVISLVSYLFVMLFTQRFRLYMFFCSPKVSHTTPLADGLITYRITSAVTSPLKISAKREKQTKKGTKKSLHSLADKFF